MQSDSGSSSDAVGQPGGAPDLAAAGADLADVIVSALEQWVRGCIARYVVNPDPIAVRDACEQATAEVEPPLRALLAADVDQQQSTPLTIVRRAVQFPTRVIAAAGVPPVERDPFTERSFPEDVYALSPATWSDLGESVADPGLRWSVTKAFVHRQRHQRSAP